MTYEKFMFCTWGHGMARREGANREHHSGGVEVVIVRLFFDREHPATSVAGCSRYHMHFPLG